jgi:hypothetical protein
MLTSGENTRMCTDDIILPCVLGSHKFTLGQRSSERSIVYEENVNED